MKAVIAVAVLLGAFATVIAAVALRRTVASSERSANEYDVLLINESIEHLTGRVTALEERVTGIDEATKATFGALSDSLQQRDRAQPPAYDPRDGLRDETISKLESEVRELGDVVAKLQARERSRELYTPPLPR